MWFKFKRSYAYLIIASLTVLSLQLLFINATPGGSICNYNSGKFDEGTKITMFMTNGQSLIATCRSGQWVPLSYPKNSVTPDSCQVGASFYPDGAVIPNAYLDCLDVKCVKGKLLPLTTQVCKPSKKTPPVLAGVLNAILGEGTGSMFDDAPKKGSAKGVNFDFSTSGLNGYVAPGDPNVINLGNGLLPNSALDIAGTLLHEFEHVLNYQSELAGYSYDSLTVSAADFGNGAPNQPGVKTGNVGPAWMGNTPSYENWGSTESSARMSQIGLYLAYINDGNKLTTGECSTLSLKINQAFSMLDGEIASLNSLISASDTQIKISQAADNGSTSCKVSGLGSQLRLAGANSCAKKTTPKDCKDFAKGLLGQKLAALGALHDMANQAAPHVGLDCTPADAQSFQANMASQNTYESTSFNPATSGAKGSALPSLDNIAGYFTSGKKFGEDPIIDSGFQTKQKGLLAQQQKTKMMLDCAENSLSCQSTDMLDKAIWDMHSMPNKCNPNACQDSSGIMYKDGATVNLYMNPSVDYPSVCKPKTYLCKAGKWYDAKNMLVSSGPTEKWITCEQKIPPCAWGGRSFSDGEVWKVYASASVAYGESCKVISEFKCNKGTWSPYSPIVGPSSCTVRPPEPCVSNGKSYSVGSSVQFFKSSSVPYGGTCESTSYKCTSSGWLPQAPPSSGQTSCSVQAPANCTYDKSYSHMSTLSLYPSQVAPPGMSCAKSTYVCNNGSWSPSIPSSASTTCKTSCFYGGQSYLDGASISLYKSASVPAGSSCGSPTNYTCSSGKWINSSANGISIESGGSLSCSVQTPSIQKQNSSSSSSTNITPKTCAYSAGVVDSGKSIYSYKAALVPSGAACEKVLYNCQNGIWDNPPPANIILSCSQIPPTSSGSTNSAGCVYRQSTFSNGTMITAYSSGPVTVSKVVRCENGVWNPSLP